MAMEWFSCFRVIGRSTMENVTVVAMSPKAEVAATLVIQDFAVAMAKKPRLCIESDVFRVRGAPMRLEVYPSGRTEQRRGVRVRLPREQE